ncbi:MAG: hypothetical protein F4211_05440 [Acidimicrobiia bacterium]|nr:hypothetical protein [Acidimicrobiia bacterium]
MPVHVGGVTQPDDQGQRPEGGQKEPDRPGAGHHPPGGRGMFIAGRAGAEPFPPSGPSHQDEQRGYHYSDSRDDMTESGSGQGDRRPDEIPTIFVNRPDQAAQIEQGKGERPGIGELTGQAGGDGSAEDVGCGGFHECVETAGSGTDHGDRT